MKRELRVKKAVPAERLEKKKERVAEKAEFINKENALLRLKKKLGGRALVHDNEETQDKLVKKVKKSDPSDIIPMKNFQGMSKVSFNENENGVNLPFSVIASEWIN